MATILQIAWAAGIYEGEGTFSGGRSVRVVQKDPWLVYELQRIFGGSVGQQARDDNVYHHWTMTGAKARGFLLTIFTFLSPRRKAQILEYPLFFKDPNFLPPDFCSKCGREFTEENTVWEIAYKEDGVTPRKWRACKFCRKERYDKKNEKRRNESFEDKTIRLIAKSRKISKEEASEIFRKTIN